MSTCTAPTLATCPGRSSGEAYPPSCATHVWRDGSFLPTQTGGSAMSFQHHAGDHCPAPGPASCEETDWPPQTSWERYAAERAAGTRVPPSVSVWREQDVRRQAAADREALAQAPVQEPRVLPWGHGPGCEGQS